MDTAATVASRRTAMGLVIVSVGMLFAAFTASYLVRRTAPDFRDVRLPGILWAATVLLALSSGAMEGVRRTRGSRWLGAAAALGAGFVALQAVAWFRLAKDGHLFAAGPKQAFVTMMTAVHALHVLFGVAALVYVSRKGRGHDVVAVFWHFLGAVWIYLLLLLTVL